MQCFLISLFAPLSVIAVLMESGALFQILAEFLEKLSFSAVDLASWLLTGLKLFTLVVAPFFKIGKTTASFQWFGTVPEEMDALMMWVSGTANTLTPFSKHYCEIPSEPELFFFFMLFMALITVFTVTVFRENLRFSLNLYD